LLPDKYRLLIKSTLCSWDRGVLEEKQRVEHGETVKYKEKVAERPDIDEETQFTVGVESKEITITTKGKSRKFPVPRSALKYKDRNG